MHMGSTSGLVLADGLNTLLYGLRAVTIMMKRKHNESCGSQQPIQRDSKSKPKQGSGYLVDTKLIPRVRQYLSTKKNNKVISVATMVDELQKRYGEYRRKKRSAFFKSVEKAYQVICNDLSDSECGDRDNIVDMELKHISKKKRKENGSESQSDDSDGKSFSSENPEYVSYEDRNAVNRFLTDMYKSNPKQSGKEGTEPLSGRFVVDKQQGEHQERPMIPKVGPILQGVLGVGNDPANEMSELGGIVPDSSNLEEPQGTHGNSAAEADLDTSRQSDIKLKPQSTQGENSLRNRRSKKTPDKNDKTKGIQIQKSAVTFADVGGNETSLIEICKLLVHMRHPEVYQTLGVTPPRGFLLHGPPGCGKTLLAHAIAGELDLPFLKLAAPEIVSGVSGESEEKIRDLFDKAVACAPCIMFIDEIDAITPKRETASKDMERRIVAQLLTCLDDLNSKTSVQVLVIGASNRPDSLDPALRRAGRFDREISLGIPDESARERILGVLCRNLKLSENFDLAVLARDTPGFVGADLMALAREAAMTAVNRVFNELECGDSMERELIQEEINETAAIPETEKLRDSSLSALLTWLKEQPPLTENQLKNLSVSMADFKAALQHVQPSAKREGFATIPDVTWDDIGALHSVRQELKLAILAPIRHKEDFKALGLTNPPGILLAGPPGCGKTLLAKAIANESGINFISVKGPELLNMYVGESERAVRQVFQRARNSAPCVIFFDELDALCPRRSDAGEGGSSVRVVNQLLTEMDGLEERKQVFIMGATNRPDIIDPAILRPGRLDKLLYVGLPTLDERLDILTTITKNGAKPKLADDVSLSSIAEKCEGFTGADLAAVVREAAMSALKERIDDTAPSTGSIEVYNRHFDMALVKVKPSVSKKDHLVYEKMQQRLQT